VVGERGASEDGARAKMRWGGVGVAGQMMSRAGGAGDEGKCVGWGER